MTKKKSQPIPLLWLLLQLIITLSVVLCILTFLHHHHHRNPLSAEEEEEERLRFVDVGNPKVAFLFLARANLPLDFLWHAFFKNAELDGGEDLFSIYIHSRPGFVFDKSTTRSYFFYGRQLRRSVKVGWGEPSMIEAERMLLAAALDDPANQRFILLSESCVPLYNFSYTYSYLMSSSKSFVDSFLDEKETRYNPKMSPTISKETWRKGSQWITLVRKHAVVVVSDEIIFPVFKRHCKRRPELNLEEKHKIKPIILQHNCIPDEHYVQTLLSMSGLEHELEKRTLTYTSWNRSKNVKGKQTWHPITFEYVNGSPKQINAIKGINHVDYQTEFRTEWCRCNSTFVPCYLFARKFSRGAAMRILTEGFVGTFNAASLLVQNSL
ncbi:uncharacterized protein M6B38_198300 [Iris pallida]|uniref:Core-2/I-branching beta-1,6-N-acetylglucosaminyltransferase family protein n=1 Tax=Iris pallida TaxID=29817 RepID=A0AAX6EBT1_IRIPA|nr:uncharacterized protein M6B38_198300 [Iris pallida]